MLDKKSLRFMHARTGTRTVRSGKSSSLGANEPSSLLDEWFGGG